MATYLLDNGAGNVRSLVNAVRELGHEINYITELSDFDRAERIIFPGVGAFGSVMESLRAKGYVEPLKKYIASGRPFMGICVGMQVLFEGSEESPKVSGLGIIPGVFCRFSNKEKAVPHMGWNHPLLLKYSPPSTDPSATHPDFDFGPSAISYNITPQSAYYFVHSFAVPYDEATLKDWALCTTQYGNEVFVAAVARGRILCTQFHPEKSGPAGLRVLNAFLAAPTDGPPPDSNVFIRSPALLSRDQFSKRIVAALDVRANDQGDLVVTKGDQYDVREHAENGKGQVRNLGKPVDLAKRYYAEGVDEICFLNITSFRSCPLQDLPMLEVLRRASESIFVPLTIGGGIRDFTEPNGTVHRAIDVVTEYFRSGADKVSLGSDAVYATEKYFAADGRMDGTTAIEQIARCYGSQAVVVSVDPRRVYVQSPSDTAHHTIRTKSPGPNGEQYCWFQCTVAGGREGRDVDVHQLAEACQALGAGEILLNSMDKDGTNSGFDLELIGEVHNLVHIPVVASSGAGCKEHFSELFQQTGVEAALAAGIFHRREVPVLSVKEHLKACSIDVRCIL